MTTETAPKTSTGAVRFALWMVPDAATRPPLARLIDAFAARYGGPRFAPHVTLAAGIADEALARTLAREGRLEIEQHPPARQSFVLGEVGFAEEPFRALFLKAPRQDWLLLAEARVRKRGGLERADYLPHVSLFYGWLTDGQRRAASAAAKDAGPFTFKAHAIEIWQTVESVTDVASWRLVEALPLFDG